MRRIRNLALMGFMGTGKSSVGRIAAAELGFEFVDTDALVEKSAGQSIADCFAQQGEGAFRALESAVVQALAPRERLVIATGGGLVVTPGNLESLRAHALMVCLWAGPETILRRTQHHTHRPLLMDADPLAKIRELLALREPHYRRADIIINSDHRPLREVAQQVIHQFMESVAREA